MENHLSYPLHTLSDRWVVAYHGIVSVNATHKMIVVINQDRFDGVSSPCLFSFPVQADSIWCIVDRKYTSFLSRYRSIITLTTSSESTLRTLETFVMQTSKRHDSVLPCCTTCCCSIAFQMLKELEASVPVIHVHMVTFVVQLWHELRYYCSTFTKLLHISSIPRRIVYSI